MNNTAMKFKFTRKKIFIGVLFLGIFAVGFTGAYFALKASKMFVKNPPSPSPVASAGQDNVSFGAPAEVAAQKGVYNTVLLGYGGAGHAGGLLTDSIIIVHVDTNKKNVALFSIPRDLWVTGNHKINAEASINGFQNEGGVIKSVTGLPVDYFLAVDFSGFSKLINNLGGITVEVPKTFDDTFYPIAGLENDMCGKTPEEIAALKAKYSDYQLETQFTCRYEHLHFDKGTTNLDGSTALKFVRSRHGDSDFGRSERQFAVLKGVLAKLISLHAFDKTNQTIDSLVSIVKTNLNVAAIKSLIEVVGDTGAYKITEIHLTTGNLLNEGKSADGAYILYPKAGMLNFADIKSLISQNI
jgi:anionic cell wall polymer biosynthesis LytR-Cps2A-Psr (LCP) family protein